MGCGDCFRRMAIFKRSVVYLSKVLDFLKGRKACKCRIDGICRLFSLRLTCPLI